VLERSRVNCLTAGLSEVLRQESLKSCGVISLFGQLAIDNWQTQQSVLSA
jgi:hypothetical protein